MIAALLVKAHDQSPCGVCLAQLMYINSKAYLSIGFKKKKFVNYAVINKFSSLKSSFECYAVVSTLLTVVSGMETLITYRIALKQNLPAFAFASKRGQQFRCIFQRFDRKLQDK